MDNQSYELIEKARSLARSGKYEDAEQILHELRALHPQEAEILAACAFVCSQRGDTEAAIAAASEAIAIRPNEPAYFFTRGRHHFSSRRYIEAVDDFSDTIRLCQFHNNNYYEMTAYFFRADAFLRLGDIERARADCAHVSPGFHIWTDSLRTKEDLLIEIEQP
jgi:tetratricopeptide (TPR) repeat protein